MDDLQEDKEGLLRPDSDESEQFENYRDVLSFLDQQSFDVSKSIVQRLVDYAGKQFRDR